MHCGRVLNVGVVGTNCFRLEIPARLKIAIQQVLDESSPEYQPTSFFGLQADEPAPLESPAVDGQTAYEQQTPQEQWWGQSEGAAMGLSAGAYDYTASTGEGSESVSGEAYECSAASYVDPLQGYASDHYYYYDPTTASYIEWHSEGNEAAVEGSYDRGSEAAPIEVASGCSDCGQDGNDVVEAETVEVVEGEIAHDVPELCTTEQYASAWTCGQCTFTNPISEAFCEMCMGHVSLSPDAASMGIVSGTTREEWPSADAHVVSAVGQSASTLSPPCVNDGGGVGASSVVSVPDSEQVAPPPVPIAIHPSSMVQLPHGTGGIGLSVPTSPAYAPSAPEFDQEDDCVSPDALDSTADRLEISDSSEAGGKAESVDFLALAFQRKTPIDRAATASAPDKTSLTRREEAADYV